MPPVRIGAWVKVSVIFRIGGNQTFRVSFWVRVIFGVGGQFSWEEGNCPRNLLQCQLVIPKQPRMEVQRVVK